MMPRPSVPDCASSPPTGADACRRRRAGNPSGLPARLGDVEPLSRSDPGHRSAFRGTRCGSGRVPLRADETAHRQRSRATRSDASEPPPPLTVELQGRAARYVDEGAPNATRWRGGKWRRRWENRAAWRNRQPPPNPYAARIATLVWPAFHRQVEAGPYRDPLVEHCLRPAASPPHSLVPPVRGRAPHAPARRDGTG